MEIQAINNNLTDLDSKLSSAIINFAIDSWRFAKNFRNLAAKLQPSEQKRANNQLHFYLKKIDEALNSVHCRFVDYTGNKYDPGLPISVINLDEFTYEDELVIEQMLEPVVIGNTGIIRIGTATVGRIAK